MTKNRELQMLAWLVAMTAVLCCVVSAGAAALPPRIELDARMRTADGAIVDETIVAGTVLRSGDELRLRVTAWADGHLYVIALGSSGTAVLLHPFKSGPVVSAQRGALSAPVRGGEAVAVPADGGYLPLDDRIGQEMIVAFVADEPVESLTRLMFRMEGLFNEPVAAREVLASEGFEPGHISFAHASRAVAIASTYAARSELPALTAAAPSVTGAVDSRASAENLPIASAPAKAQRKGVLGGLGSRIAQFAGQSTDQRRESSPTVPATMPLVDTEQRPPVEPDVTPSPAGGSLFSRWFGFDEKDEGDSPIAVAAEPEPAKPDPAGPNQTRVQEAQTFALPLEHSSTRLGLPPRELARALPPSADAAGETKPALGARSGLQTTFDVPANVPTPSASNHVALAKESATVVATARVTSRVVEPLPAEATLYPPGRQPTVSRTARAATAEVIISRSAESAEQSGSWFSGLGALFSGGSLDEPSADESADGSRGESRVERGKSSASDSTVAQTSSATRQRTTLVVQPVETLTTDAQVGAVESSTVQGEEVAKTDDAGDGLFAGLSALLKGSTTGEGETHIAIPQTATPRAGRATEPAGVDERAQSAELPAFERLVAAPLDNAAGELPASKAPAAVEDRSRVVMAPLPQSDAESSGPATVSGFAQPATMAQESAREVALAGGGTAGADEITGTPPGLEQERQDDSFDSSASATGSGLFAGLGRLFGGNDTSDPSDSANESVQASDEGMPVENRTENAVENRAENERRTDVAITQDVARTDAADNESTDNDSTDIDSPDIDRTGQAAVKPLSEGGLLAGLGALLTNPFASAEDESPSTPSVQAQEPSRSAPQSVNSGNEPNIKRRVDRDGKKVVVLSGLPAARAGEKENPEVLGGSGSRIRRLLDEPEPQTVAASVTEVETAAAASVANVAATPATPPAAPVTVVAEPPPPPVPASVANVQPDPVQPDPVQSVPVNGDDSVAASASAKAPQPVALLTAAPAKGGARTVTALASVDVNSDRGVASSVVLVITPSGSTSGVLIDRNGHLLTNWHSVSKFDEVVVMFKQRQGSRPRRNDAVRARVVAHSKFADLALLKVETVPAGLAPAVVVADVEMESGSPIHAIGHATGRGGDGQWRHDIASVDRVRRSSSWYSAQRVLHRADVIRAKMNPVHDVTGAPLFNNRLELIGIGAMVRADKGEIVGVSAATIRAFLKAAS